MCVNVSIFYLEEDNPSSILSMWLNTNIQTQCKIILWYILDNIVGPHCGFSRTAGFFKTTKLKVVLTAQIGGPHKTTKLKLVLTTQIGGSYKTNVWCYINYVSNNATYCSDF